MFALIMEKCISFGFAQRAGEHKVRPSYDSTVFCVTTILLHFFLNLYNDLCSNAFISKNF